MRLWRKEKRVERTGRMWDYREQRWGWAVSDWRSNDGGLTVKALGFGTGLSAGDVLAMAGAEYRAGNKDSVSAYLIESIEYFNDPPDMWKASLAYTRDIPVGMTVPTLEQILPGHWAQYGPDYPARLAK